MASSLALTRLVSSNILPSPLRVATAPSTSRIFNTNAATRDDRDLNDDRSVGVAPGDQKGKAKVKNGVLKSGPSFLRRRRRGMM
uniref:Uncharacterized protein n=1 Tax=Gossypium raimondii TaxID=29730 RepID=A0A0D2TM38_GOSRA|nr:hypothetical protein B456_009G090800 [Gossypium raimondii]